MDDRLLTPPEEALGQRALALLTGVLADIARVVSPEPLKRLRSTPIVLDLRHGKLTNLQYHPSPKWLTENGYSEKLAKCVHVPTAALLVDPSHHHRQPGCILHELAHSFHDQVLGLSEPRILHAWEKYRASGQGDAVLHITGRRIPHYALTNQKRFFAEMSEAYFGANDFFPFNRAELKDAEPEILALLQAVWGPTPE